MDDLIRITKSIKKLLAEAELKDIIGNIKKGDMVQMTLNDGTNYTYKVEAAHIGNLLLRDTSDNGLFTFNVKDYTTNGLLMYQYANGKKGNSTNLKVKSLNMGTPHGHIYQNVEPIDNNDMDLNFEPDFPKKDAEPEPEDDMGLNFEPGFEKREPEPEPEDDESIESSSAKESIDQMNKNILEAKVGDNLHLTVNVDNEDAELDVENDNNLVFEVKEITEQYISCILTNIKGPISAVLEKILNNKELAIKKDSLIKVENGQAVLDLIIRSSGKKATIPNIVWVGINEYQHEPEDEDEAEGKYTLSQAELDKIMYDNKELADYWLKTPGAVGTLFDASPSGRYTIAKQLKQLKMDTAYLGKGSKIKFRLLSTEKTGAGGKNLDPKKTEGYEGIFIEDNLIRAWGQVDKKHWKIKLRSKVKGNHSYEASFKFCMNRNECYDRGKGTIQLIDIDNDGNKKK